MTSTEPSLEDTKTWIEENIESLLNTKIVKRVRQVEITASQSDFVSLEDGQISFKHTFNIFLGRNTENFEYLVTINLRRVRISQNGTRFVFECKKGENAMKSVGTTTGSKGPAKYFEDQSYNCKSTQAADRMVKALNHYKALLSTKSVSRDLF
ncbi:MAG: hypothetical protein O3C43_06385 [Verrucomicrobia bacterium]|nr:hypothetical protein [Verrucomicrobiota bacterium]MDA1066114.1 hypothetical protein [Verrucomicrobiota bacterium]